MKRKTKLKKLMEVYCARQSLKMDQIHFLFYGNRLCDTRTPDKLQMEDNDILMVQPKVHNERFGEEERNDGSSS